MARCRAKKRVNILSAFMLLASTHALGDAQSYSPFFMFGRAHNTPIGYKELCERAQAWCAPDKQQYGEAVYLYNDDELMSDLMRVNAYWNKRIESVLDIQKFGVAELWQEPGTFSSGDCEEYVLAKRDNLIELGYPRQSLLISVVRETRPGVQGNGHAVLSVLTKKGVLVLDNQTPEIMLWSKTGYDFYKVQNPSHPSQWLLVEDSIYGENPPVRSLGLRPALR